MNSTVLYVDEERRARNLYSRLLEEIYGGSIEVKAIAPEANLEQMLTVIASEPDLVSLVLDEKLLANGDANFLGSGIADAYRAIDSALPIYILTNKPEEVPEFIGSVEYVLSKTDIAKDEYVEKYSKQLSRHIDRYDRTLDDRESKLAELISKSIAGSLSSDDEEEFKSLQNWKARSFIYQETQEAIELRELLDSQAKILDDLEKELKGS